MTETPKLSLVSGTWNRLLLLQDMIESIRTYTTVPLELVIVDGGSTDGTLEWLRTQADVRLVEQGELLGAIKAYNAGFQAATAAYVGHINDDAVVTDDCYGRCCRILDEYPEIAQVAIPYFGPHQYDKVDYVYIGKDTWHYANFGVTRREIGSAVGWWGDEYYHYGGDVECSMRIHNNRLEIVALEGSRVLHKQANDELRRPNEDFPAFFKKWYAWNGPGDERPGYGWVPELHEQLPAEDPSGSSEVRHA